MGAWTRGGAGGPGNRRGWGRPGAKAARGGGREGAQRSGPAPPLTRFSSSSSSSGARAAAATTSHSLLQLSSDRVAAPPVSPAGPSPPRPLRPPIGQRLRHSSIAEKLAPPHWSGSVLPRPYRPPSVPLQNPATPALPSKRRQLHLVAAGPVPPLLPWRRIPAHGQKLTLSLAESAVAPGETRVCVGLFGYKRKEGVFRRLQSPSVIGWPWSDSYFHWLRSPPITVRVTPSLFSFSGETFGHQREKAGKPRRTRKRGECARTSVLSFHPPYPQLGWTCGCQGDKTLLTTLPGTKGFSFPSQL